MQNLSLWQLDNEYLAVIEELEYNDGELDEELETRLDTILASLVQKQDNYIKMMDTLGVLEDQAKDWRDKMNRRIQSIAHQRERLKQALILHLHRLGTTEMRGTLGTVRLMKLTKVGNVDERALPAIYKRIVQEIRIDRQRLLRDLKQGPVKGAELEEVEYVRVF